MQTIAITPGDPTGIGPEITVKFLHKAPQHFPNTRFVVVGSVIALAESARLLELPLPPQNDNLSYVPIESELPGQVSVQALEKAVALIAQGQAQAVVTGPISKENLAKAGVLSHGHTELLEVFSRKYFPQAKSAKAQMLFEYQNLRLLLLTRHIPLSQVSSVLSHETIKPAFQMLSNYLTQQLGIRSPKIAVLGVNPHAGEIGGVEETLVLSPLMEELNLAGPSDFSGPYAADAFFRGFDLQQFPYDGVIAMYHDQGLIPFKLIAGFKAVNVTIGLPFIRTSVSHGTAPDIAGLGLASETSLMAAIRHAQTLCLQNNGLSASV